MSLGDEHDGFGGVGGSGQTRTRLPEGNSGDVYGGARRPVRSSRSLITVVGVVVLLIAAIAFANRGGGDPADAAPSAGTPGEQAPTAATGVRPVKEKNGAIPTGFARDEQGAQSAATNYAVTLGSDGMFKKTGRHQIVDTVYTPDAAKRLKTPQDEAYSAEFLKRLGLDAEGNPPAGNTFVSRTIPVGAKVESYDGDTAKVSVWYTGLIGMSGPDSTDPVSTTWMTWTFDLRWTNNDWKIADDSQTNGPAPVPGDVTASTADEISKAVEEFGGFTYAR
ncbi:hypothetical protein [Streptomyces sp. NBC_00094]|uniref:hypothetical protein n=1 Tax=Streptomyces sp. NBC_00094 TaxID=2903620 RepID=UPI0022525C24|nr:hypothetical protein [Streptomyces sp. NBC_00094]MCX5392121.1 hypothetical protein [Streptomyces sp. NBC_00094]